MAIYYKEYNWFLAGSFISRTGEWFERIAINWLVFTLTKSAFYVGMIEFSRLFPILLFSLIGGVVADRWNRRHVLLAAQITAMIVTFGLAFIIYSGVEEIFYFIWLLFIRGICLAFELPARNALVPNLVPPKAMASGLSIFNGTLNLAGIIGSALAGILLLHLPIYSLIFLNCVSFLAVIFTIWIIKKGEISSKSKEKPPPFLRGMGEIFHYLKKHKRMIGVLSLGLVPSIAGFPYTTLMPSFAEEILRVGSEGFGMLLSATACGSFFTAIFLSGGKYPFSKGKLSFLTVVGFGLTLILLSFSHYFLLSLFIMFLVGVLSQGFRVVDGVIIHEMIPDYLRGRMLSIRSLLNGLLPLGSLLCGYLAELIGVGNALSLMGMVCIGGAVLVLRFNKEIYSIK